MRTHKWWAGLLLGVALGMVCAESVVRAVSARSAPVAALEQMAHGPISDPGSTATAGYMSPSPLAPIHPETVTLAGSASATTVSTIAGHCLRVVCTTDAFFLSGATAAATDNPIYAKTPETICLRTGTQTQLSFYSASAGSCVVGIRGL